jgi:hypothetical protein
VFWALGARFGLPPVRARQISLCVRGYSCARLLTLPAHDCSLSLSLSLRAAAPSPCARLLLPGRGCSSRLLAAVRLLPGRTPPWARGCYLFPSTGRVVGPPPLLPPPLLSLKCQDSRMMFLTSSSNASPGFRLSGFCQVSRTQDCAASRFLSSVKTASSSE